MIWFLIAQIVTMILGLLALRLSTDKDKDLGLLVLRQQIRILERRLGKPVRATRAEKLVLLVTAVRLKAQARQGRQRLQQSLLIFRPATLLKWHRALVKRKSTFQRHAQLGRPRLATDREGLIVRLANENSGFGYEKLQGELLKLGCDVGISTVRAVLERHAIPPAPERDHTRSNWHTFLNHYKTQMLACDFFTLESVFLQTLYVLFFIELSTRRVYVADCTRHPDSAWVTQQTRQLIWQLHEDENPMRFLIHDRDTKFTASFEAVLAAEGVETLLTPYRAPNANAFAERWVRSVRAECLDQLLILNQPHLRRVWTEYTDYSNSARPHQGLQQQAPIPFQPGPMDGPIHCRDILGGIIHDYRRQAA